MSWVVVQIPNKVIVRYVSYHQFVCFRELIVNSAVEKRTACRF